MKICAVSNNIVKHIVDVLHSRSDFNWQIFNLHGVNIKYLAENQN